MKPLLFSVLMWVPIAGQQIPRMGTDPMQKVSRPPVVKVGIQPPDPLRAETAHAKALEELSQLILEASQLQAELQADGPSKVRAGALRQAGNMQKHLKRVESYLKAK